MISILDWFLGFFARSTEPLRPWHRLPFIPAIATVIGHRVNLRRNNLIDTEREPPQIPRPNDVDVIGSRTYDGTFNDLAKPWMGMAGARFGRNIPLEDTYAETHSLFEPNPREVSNALLKRDEFIPVPHLNVIAAAWIQFMLHDWVNHGLPSTKKHHTIPPVDNDNWPQKDMKIGHTKPDSDRSPLDEGKPKTYRNEQTHWWDASQLYGSSRARNHQLRTPPGRKKITDDGKLWLDKKGFLPAEIQKNGKSTAELSGFNQSWWTGLSVLHTLFAREHNTVVDRLKIEYPNAEGEWLFQKARLVISALIAKIHTVEWTPALMDSDKGRMLMRGNYWGLRGERYFNTFGRVSNSEVVSGIPGSTQDHHTAPFSMTEEFGAAYRLHSLIPDNYEFRRVSDNKLVKSANLYEISNDYARQLYTEISFADAVYSLGISHPGALTLHNYPDTLRNLQPNPFDPKSVIDLASVDILRDRERGIPRFQKFRELTGMKPPKTFADITDNVEWQKELKAVYGSVDKVDFLIGTLAESQSKNGTPFRFGFSDTVFRIFIVMASRRLKSDRFYTDDFRPEVYTKVGYEWVLNNGMFDVLERHCPELKPLLRARRNAFFPFDTAK